MAIQALAHNKEFVVIFGWPQNALLITGGGGAVDEIKVRLGVDVNVDVDAGAEFDIAQWLRTI